MIDYNKYEKFRLAILERHDVYCNQKYETREGYVELPYSFHLIATESIAIRFAEVSFGDEYLKKYISDTNHYLFGATPTYLDYIKCVAIAHDVLEDGRMTYKDLHKLLMRFYGEHPTFCKLVAMSCYALTDEKGRTRDERKNDKFYKELNQDSIAKYIKICDRFANVSYGKMMGGSMLDKYREEHPNFYGKLNGQSSFTRIFFELNALLTK